MIRESLLAFIVAAQEAVPVGRYIVMQCAGTYPELWIGNTYQTSTYGRHVSFWTSPSDQEELPNEEAVDRFMAALTEPEKE